MHSFDRERLLNDVLEDESYRQFRAETFAALRREVRRRRGTSRLPWLALAAALVLVAMLWQRPSEERAARPVQTTPTAAAGMAHVTTQPLRVVDVVRSVPDKGLIVETPKMSGANVQMVHTLPVAVRSISDAQLLAHFADRPAGFLFGSGGKGFIVFEERN